MDGERRWSGSEFQTTGAAMKKLRLPSLVVLVHEKTDRHARLSGNQGGLNCQRLCGQWGRPSASDTALKSQFSNFELYRLMHWQPVEVTAMNCLHSCCMFVWQRTSLMWQNRKPVHLLQHWRDAVVTSSARHQMCSRILDTTAGSSDLRRWRKTVSCSSPGDTKSTPGPASLRPRLT